MTSLERRPTSGISSSVTVNFRTTRYLGTTGSSCGTDVLVDVEEVVRVVLGLDLRQALVVVPVGRLDALLALFQSHHVQRPAAERVRMERLPVADAPVAQGAGRLGLGIGIDADDDLRPVRVAV